MKNKFLKYTVTVALLVVLIGGTVATAGGYNLENGFAAVVQAVKKKVENTKHKEKTQEQKVTTNTKQTDVQNKKENSNKTATSTKSVNTTTVKPGFVEKIKSAVVNLKNKALPLFGAKKEPYNNCHMLTSGGLNRCICIDSKGTHHDVDISYCENTTPTYYTLKIEQEDGGRVTGKSGKIKAGEKVTLTATPKKDYLIYGWRDGGEYLCGPEKKTCTFTMDKDRYVYVDFQKLETIRIQDPNKCSEFVKKLFNSNTDQRTFTEKANAIINNETMSKDEKNRKLKKLLNGYIPLVNLDKDKFESCFSLGWNWTW